MMRARCAGAIAVAAAVCLPSPAVPFGGDGHRLVNRHAVDNLPASMQDDGSGNAFGDMRLLLEYQATAPDWQKSYDGDENARHWCNIDSLLWAYPPPFDTVPRDQAAYLSAFGRDNGVLQWEGIEEHYGRLVGLMRARNWLAAYQCAAELGHYVADASCPLHCTRHFDGYRYWHPLYDPRNVGIHSRYESEMVTRHIPSLATAPGSAVYVVDRVECGFALIAGGWNLFDEVLAADLEAQDETGGDSSPAYFQALYDRVGTDAEARLELAARRTSDLWYSAWIDAGSPSFSPAAIRFSFQALSPPAPSGWGVSAEHPYGPFGAFGW